MDFDARFKAARRTSQSLVGWLALDQPAAIKKIASLLYKGKPKAKGKGTDDAEQIAAARKDDPLIEWDLVRGFNGVNDAGQAAITAAVIEWHMSKPVPAGTQPTEPPQPEQIKHQVLACQIAGHLDTYSVLVIHNAHSYFPVGEQQAKDPNMLGFIQALMNLRDPNKSKNRMVVLLAPDLSNLPPELKSDVLLFEEPVPSRAILREVVQNEVKSWNDSHADKASQQIEIDDATVERAIDALRGIETRAIAAQAVSMAISKDGIDISELERRKVELINATPGLEVLDTNYTFDDVVGYEGIKEYLRTFIAGKKKFRCVVLDDEIEKDVAGANKNSGDSTTTEMLGDILTKMENMKWPGFIFIGPPGAGKTLLARAIAGEAKVPLILRKLSGAKDKWVGTSNQNARRQMRVIEAVSDGQPLFVATSNGLSDVPAEYQRRYRTGTWFVGLPSADGRPAIWKHYIKKFDLPDTATPDDAQWTGADIYNCCDQADNLGIPLVKAARYIVPVAKSSSEKITKLCGESSGKYLDAETGETYKFVAKIEPMKKKAESSDTRMHTEGD